MNIEKYTLNIYSFANFVNEMENWTEYSKEISNYWWELEILNATALDEWERAGKPVFWKKWDSEYKHSAKELSSQLLDKIDLFINSKAKYFSIDFNNFSKFILEIEKDDYVKSKFFHHYRELEDIYFIISLNEDDWEIYQGEIFILIKEILNSAPYLLSKIKNE